MPADGLSLVGFHSETNAMRYFSTACAYRTMSKSRLKKWWQEAQEKIGPPFTRAGQPTLETLDEYESHLAQVVACPIFQDVLEGMQYEFRLVEVDRLLAFQMHIDVEKCQRICVSVPDSPSVADMLPIALPRALEHLDIQAIPQQNSLIISSENTNLWAYRIEYLGRSHDQDDGLYTVRIKLGARPGLIQVVEYGGKCYLKNGYHRAYGLRQKHAEMIPCLYLKASWLEQTGATLGGFPIDIFYGPNPPTCGHFTQNRAWPVKLRKRTQAYQIGCADCSTWES